MSPQVYQQFDAEDVTEEMLEQAAMLFNENYGIWGADAAKTSIYTKPGKSR